ncbi:hypothetical protein HC864_02960 [Candidatus Gracilibacteria bacterium]|nr:hypothetical protein [Candidatus Gracilibacteria bacterium]
MSNIKNPFSTEPYKGTRDFYPQSSLITPGKSISYQEHFKYIESKIEKVLITKGFSEYSSSIIEYSDVFKAKSGDELANRALYEFVDKGDRRITLRPELTLGASRMVANQFQNLRFPLRWYSWDNNFRYERPQKGRLREFWQMEINIIGEEAGGSDLEIMSLVTNLFKEFGATAEMYTLKLNHRGVLNKWIEQNKWTKNQSQIFAILDNWYKSNPQKTQTELSSFLNDIDVQKIINTINKVGSSWQEYMQICENFPEISLIYKTFQEIYPKTPLELTPTIIRGQSYYTGIIFECFDTNKNNPRSLFGGGRFDGLLDIFGKQAPAVGFAPGEVSFHEFLLNWNLYPEKFSSLIKVGIIPKSPDNLPQVFSEIIPALHQVNKTFDIDYQYDRKENKRYDTLKKRGCDEIITLG